MGRGKEGEGEEDEAVGEVGRGKACSRGDGRIPFESANEDRVTGVVMDAITAFWDEKTSVLREKGHKGRRKGRRRKVSLVVLPSSTSSPSLNLHKLHFQAR